MVAQGQDFEDFALDVDKPEVKNTDEFDLSRPKIYTATKCIGKDKSGYRVKRYLMIEYPWDKIKNSSLEVRIIGPEAEKQPQFCKPVFFMSKYGKLDRISNDIFYKRLNRLGYRDNLEYPTLLFHEHGLPEPELVLATIKPLVGARADFFHFILRNPETHEFETTLIFHDLEQWSADKERLVIELRGKRQLDDRTQIEFEKPCKIMLWLLRDDYVVWEETFLWPGTEKDNPKKDTKKKSSNTVKDKDEDPRDEAKKLETEAKNTTDSPEETDDGDGFGGFDEDF